jgi:hypothetical protein
MHDNRIASVGPLKPVHSASPTGGRTTENKHGAQPCGGTPKFFHPEGAVGVSDVLGVDTYRR